MAISAISGIPAFQMPAVNKPASTEAAGFGDMVTKAVDNLQNLQSNADSLATQATTGDLTNVHDYMIAATEAQLATEMTVAVRNKAVEAFQQIMGMQL